MLLLACTSPPPPADDTAAPTDTADAGDTADTADSAEPPIELDLAIPAYFYPGDEWTRATATEPVSVMIANAASGPGTAVDPAYTDAITAARAAGILVIGYVHTSYGDRDRGTVATDLDTWAALYDLDGYFIDEIPGEAECAFHTDYYKDVSRRALNNIPGGYIVVNPGTNTCGYFLTIADVVVLFEGVEADFLEWTPPDWSTSHPKQKFWTLVHGASGWEDSVAHARANNVGATYITDDVMPNPWDTLPTWWDELVAGVE